MSFNRPPEALLECHNLRCRRGDETLFSSLGFCLLEGGVLLLAGGNGTGKTSLLKCLAGLHPLEAGEINWRGEAALRSERYAQEMLYLGHGHGLKEDVSVVSNLRFWAAMAGNSMLLPAAMHYFGLMPYAERAAGRLSAGWQRRTALARLLLSPSALWLLDEPAANLDSDGVALLGSLIESRTRKGGAVIMSAHQLPQGLIGAEVPVSVLRVEDFPADDLPFNKGY